MKRQRVLGASLAAVAVLAAAWLTGCGGSLYVLHASSASARLEEAKELGAEKLSPYEYYLARELMTKAQEEAAQGDYGDALDLADDAETQAGQAIKNARAAHEASGRSKEGP